MDRARVLTASKLWDCGSPDAGVPSTGEQRHGPKRILRLVLAHQWEELISRVSSYRVLVVLE